MNRIFLLTASSIAAGYILFAPAAPGLNREPAPTVKTRGLILQPERDAPCRPDDGPAMRISRRPVSGCQSLQEND